MRASVSRLNNCWTRYRARTRFPKLRIALGLEYDGTAYNGWQRQRTGIGVQVHVENALKVVANENIEVVCAGRTDTAYMRPDRLCISTHRANA